MRPTAKKTPTSKNGYLYLQGAEIFRRYPPSLSVIQAQLEHGAVHHLSRIARDNKRNGDFKKRTTTTEIGCER